MLPPDQEALVGHIVLAFTNDGKAAYPPVLQPLVEYRTPVGAAWIMMWSGEWNSPRRAAERGKVPYRAYYRAWFREPYVTEVCISNSANERRYHDEAPFTAYLINAAGERRSFSGTVPPHGTCVLTVAEMFPEGRTFVGDTGVGMVLIESDFDLAKIQLTCHPGSGAVAAEHFMAILSSKEYLPAGS